MLGRSHGTSKESVLCVITAAFWWGTAFDVAEMEQRSCYAYNKAVYTGRVPCRRTVLKSLCTIRGAEPLFNHKATSVSKFDIPTQHVLKGRDGSEILETKDAGKPGGMIIIIIDFGIASSFLECGAT